MNASVTEIKNRLSHYLRVVARGGTVTVLDRGTPVAQITPLRLPDEAVRPLAAAGLVRPPLARLPRGFFRRSLPASKRSVTDGLIDERDDRI